MKKILTSVLLIILIRTISGCGINGYPPYDTSYPEIDPAPFEEKAERILKEFTDGANKTTKEVKKELEYIDDFLEKNIINDKILDSLNEVDKLLEGLSELPENNYSFSGKFGLPAADETLGN